MKKFILLVILIICAAIYAETIVYQPGTSGATAGNVRYAYIYEQDGDVNDFTTDEFDIGNCVLDRVVVDANGTDTSFKLYLYDCETEYTDATLWSNTSLSTASVPYSVALSISDGTTTQAGIPCTGKLKVTLADGDDATMANLQVYIYYHK